MIQALDFRREAANFCKLAEILNDYAEIVVPLPKTLLTLDETSRALDPTFNPIQLLRQNLQTLMRKHLLKTISPEAQSCLRLWNYMIWYKITGLGLPWSCFCWQPSLRIDGGRSNFV